MLLLLAVFAAGAYATIKELSYTAPILISFIPIALILMIYLTLKKKWGYIGFQSIFNIPKKNWLFYLPLVVILVIISINGFKAVTMSEVLFFIFFTLMVGFVEETIYRGLILKIMLSKSVLSAVLVSSILFSITHLLNVMSGQDLVQSVLQLIYALIMGVVLALLMIKNNNIAPLIMFHFVHNLIQFLSNEGTNIIFDVIIILVLIVQCLWLVLDLRKKGVHPQLNTVTV